MELNLIETNNSAWPYTFYTFVYLSGLWVYLSVSALDFNDGAFWRYRAVASHCVSLKAGLLCDCAINWGDKQREIEKLNFFGNNRRFLAL